MTTRERELQQRMDRAMEKIKRLNEELIEAEREWAEARDCWVSAARARMISESP